MNNPQLLQNKIEELYLKEKCSVRDIASKTGLNYSAVLTQMKSHGIPRRPRWDDLTNKRFGRLIALSRITDKKKGKHSYWTCICDCGKYVEAINADSLKAGTSKSCGCYKNDFQNHRLKEKNPRWKGGRIIKKDGYVRILLKDHPNADGHGYVMEHVAVMSEHLQRPILRSETIHHKNGIRNDNRLENLELWDRRHVPGHRVEDMIKFCESYLKIYAPSLLRNEP